MSKHLTYTHNKHACVCLWEYPTNYSYSHIEVLIASLVSMRRLRRHTRERENFFYLTTHSTHFIYDYMASDIWLRTILIVRKETRSRHIGYSYRLTAIVLLYAPSHRQDSTYHGLCYTSRGALVGTRYSSMGKKTTRTIIIIYCFSCLGYQCMRV